MSNSSTYGRLEDSSESLGFDTLNKMGVLSRGTRHVAHLVAQVADRDGETRRSRDEADEEGFLLLVTCLRNELLDHVVDVRQCHQNR